jgi:hypothetical protein
VENLSPYSGFLYLRGEAYSYVEEGGSVSIYAHRTRKKEYTVV